MRRLLVIFISSFIYSELLLAQTECLNNSEFSKESSCTTFEIVTNPSRSDGFGAQFQTIIYSVIYAELNNLDYRYTPFKSMEHNYDNSVDFIQKKEELINFIGNFELNDNPYVRIKDINSIKFFEENINDCVNSLSLKKIKRIFRSNKKSPFNTDNLHVAIHIRRLNSHDTRIAGTESSNEIYLKAIDLIRSTHFSQRPLFHIYSQGNVEEFNKIFSSDDIIFHINESVEETFTSLVLADILVTSTSSFSYAAGILSEGQVYYVPFWHPPLPNWITLQ